MDSLTWLIILIIILVFLSGFFSACETAYTSLNKIKLKTDADDGDKKAISVLKTIDKFERFLTTILIGNNIVNIAAATIAAVIFTYYFPDNGSWISTLVMTVIVLIFGEVIPKALAKANAENFAKAVNPIVIFLSYLVLPFSFLFEKLTNLIRSLFHHKDATDSLDEDDLLTIIDEIEEEGVIKPYEKELISSAVKFDDIQANDIVTPRKDITAIEVTMSEKEIHQIFDESKYTRLPVYDETIDTIIGILHEKDFYSFLMNSKSKTFEIKKLMSPAIFVPQEAKISDIFKTLKDSHNHMAIVLDQFDSTLGLITMEDIIEELVGEIYDETDEVNSETKKIGEGKYKVAGNEILDDAFSIIGIETDDNNDLDLNQTVNAWIGATLGRLPKAGDNFIFMDKWKVRVLSASRRGAKDIEISKYE